MSYTTYLKRREAGVCTTCGGPMEDTQHVNCSACREKKAAESRMRYSKKSAQEEMARYLEIDARRAEIARAIEREKAFKAMGKCLNCVWSQKHVTHLFCPFPAGTCMKL